MEPTTGRDGDQWWAMQAGSGVSSVISPRPAVPTDDEGSGSHQGKGHCHRYRQLSPALVDHDQHRNAQRCSDRRDRGRRPEARTGGLVGRSYFVSKDQRGPNSG